MGVIPIVSVALLTAASPSPSPPATPVWSDEKLLAYASSKYDKRAMMNKHEILGTHKAVRLVADFPCSDICPDYTVRIIHYELDEGQSCAAAGGLEEAILVPVGIAATKKTFCVPKVLKERAASR